MVWQRTGEDWSDVPLTLSTARSASAGEPPRLTEDRLTLRDRPAAERRTVEVELREEETATLGPAPVLGLPGVDDGGEARVLRSPAPVSVPGDGRAHRVPLSAFTADAHAEYVCSPELSPLVTQVVRCDNGSGHALLAGPVDLVRDSGFVGRGTLDFTAPGNPVELAFGSRDDVHVVRETEESRDTTGLTQRTVVTRTVRLHLSRFSAPGERNPHVVTLLERVPVSEVAAVEVELREEACSPLPTRSMPTASPAGPSASRPEAGAPSPSRTHSRRAPRSPESEPCGVCGSRARAGFRRAGRTRPGRTMTTAAGSEHRRLRPGRWSFGAAACVRAGEEVAQTLTCGCAGLR